MNTFFRTLRTARVLMLLLLANCALAGPPLTTIQDVIYKADGTRFNGLVTISWNSFEASDHSAIATQMVTVRVVEGSLRVKLVPNTTTDPPAYYTVVYNSDGRVQFNETWAVPPSLAALRLRDVRTATPVTPGDSGGGPIPESNVIGLVADLSARVERGAGYAAGKVTYVNAQSKLDSVSGNAADCVRVDGSSGPCGTAAPSFMDGESPAGIVDGANALFLLSATPSPASSLAVYRNGLMQKLGVDYTSSDRSIQFSEPATPQPGDTILAAYRLSSGDAGTPQAFPSAQVLCSRAGTTVSSTTFGSLGSCVVPAGTLASGDRVEIRFDLEHAGASAGFTYEVRWGSTAVLHRDGTAGDSLMTGRADAGLHAGGAQFGIQSWGTASAFNTAVAVATDAYGNGVTVDFQGRVAQTGETLALRNFSVVRLP